MSTPARWLLQNNKLGIYILDYGCGKGDDVEFLSREGYKIKGYDPYFAPDASILSEEYDTVLCTYVLNVVPERTRAKILTALFACDAKHIYVTVRRDLKERYIKTTKDTEQWMVNLRFPVIYEDSNFCIYQLR